MVELHVAVVGDVQDQRVLEQPEALQPLLQPAQLVVDVGDATHVADAHPVVLLRRDRAVPCGRRGAGHGHVVPFAPVAMDGARDVSVGVHVPERLRRAEGRVGRTERKPHKERCVGVALLQAVDGRVDSPVHRVEAFLEVPRPSAPAVGVDAVSPLVRRRAGMQSQPLRVVAPARFVLAASQEDAVEAVPLALWVEVAAADAETLVAVVAQHLRQGVLLAPAGFRVAELPTVVAALAAEHHALGGRCGRHLGVGVGEVGAAVDHVVDVRRLDDRVTGEAEMVAPVRVGEVEEDIGL